MILEKNNYMKAKEISEKYNIMVQEHKHKPIIKHKIHRGPILKDSL